MTKNHAVCYLRSTKDRSDVSIDAQRRALHELALQRGLVVVDEFADAVFSGADEERPAWLRLLRALKDRGRSWHHVLVLDTARVARRRQISIAFEAECHKRGVRVVYRSLPESDPATDMMLRSVMQAWDEYHSLVSRAKGLAGMAENVRQGWRAGGRAPRGYKLEYHPTGATRDGAPVLKSRLVLDEASASQVRDYLKMRARGIARGLAVDRLQLPWPATSTHSMDWQALTYAGHTVWNVHTDRRDRPDEQRDSKRRPRAEWLIQRDTHPALITEPEAEAILAELERLQQGRRSKATPLLLTGLLQAPDGAAWHSDGCGFYRLGKGKKILASRLDSCVLERARESLSSDAAVGHVQAAMLAITAGAAPVDGRTIAGLEKRISTLSAQISKTVDLAASLADPAPVLRRVSDLEGQRSGLVDELAAMRARQGQLARAVTIDAAQIRAGLRRLVAGWAELKKENVDQLSRARQVLADVLERVVLDPVSLTVRLHFAVRAGDNVASPRQSHFSPAPVARWEDDGGCAVHVRQKRAA